MIIDQQTGNSTGSLFLEKNPGGASGGIPSATPVSSGNRIGSSKYASLYEKISSTSLRSVDYGDSKPIVTKPLPAATGSNKNSWFDLEVKYPVQARVDDVARISKLLIKLQGIKWEGHTAALQTIQGNLEANRVNASKSTMGARSGNNANFLQKLGSSALTTLKSAGLALVSAVGMTASTLAQVATSGLGEHQEPFLGKSYMHEGPIKNGYGSQILSTLVSSFGFGDFGLSGNISGANKAKSGVEVVGSPAYTFVQEGNLGRDRHDFSRVQQSRYVDLKKNEDYRPTNLADSSGSRGHYAESGVNSELQKKYQDTERTPYLPADQQPFPESSSIYQTDPKSQDFKVEETVRRRTEDQEIYKDDRGKLEWSRQSGFNSEETYLETGVEGERRGESVLDRGKSYPLATDIKDLEGEEDSRKANEFQKNFNLIPFEIQSVTPIGKKVLHFQANLDSYDDSYSADWQSTSYVGRADKFYTYGGFTRDINFSFKVVALTSEHLAPIYKQLNLLAGITAPTYGEAEGETGIFMKGTLARVTIGDLLYRQYGFFKNVKFSWDTEVPWEIDGANLIVPHMLNVSIGFTPIHNFNPQATIGSYFGHAFKNGSSSTQTGNPTVTSVG